MTFNVEFDERAFKEWNKLEKTIREQFTENDVTERCHSAHNRPITGPEGRN